ncbi:MAG: dienelactone hydrolase family protein [Pseudomonadota bacterium]
MRVICRVMAIMIFVYLGRAYAGDSLPSQKEYEPPNGKGRVIVVVSGKTGTDNYVYYAKDLAEKGYYTVLVDGNDFWVKGGRGEDLLKDVITRAQQSPHALSGKVAVIGFSLGGASSLTYATRMPELVSAVVVSYPATYYITNADDFVSKIQVPTLIFAGGRDTYKNCCLVETARKLANAAKASGGKVMLEVVEYPDADHGWTIRSLKSYRGDYTAHGFRRTLDHLHQNSNE